MHLNNNNNDSTIVERERERETYVAFCSFGKDSLAQLIEIKRLNLPLDYVVYVDIRYTDEISGEQPEHAEWIETAEKILKEQFGIEVLHLRAEHPFKEQFFTKKMKGKHIGDIYGFPFVIGAWCNSRLKIRPIEKFRASIEGKIVEYVGIAYDEPKRYEKLIVRNREKRIQSRSILYENKITEQDAFKICEKYNLVSPTYKDNFRGGCWFCPKQSITSIHNLWKNNRKYFDILLELEKVSRNTMFPRYTLNQLNEKFSNGFVPRTVKKRLRKE